MRYLLKLATNFYQVIDLKFEQERCLQCLKLTVEIEKAIPHYRTRLWIAGAWPRSPLISSRPSFASRCRLIPYRRRGLPKTFRIKPTLPLDQRRPVPLDRNSIPSKGKAHP